MEKNYFRKIILLSLRIVVSAVVLYFIISLVQWKNVLSAFETARSYYIILAFILLFANIIIRTVKWHIMLNSVKRTPTFKEALGSVLLGISLGSFTPGEIGEFAGRVLHITDAKRSHILGLALLDKAQIFIVTSGLGLVSLAIIYLNDLLIIFSIMTVIIISFSFLLVRMKSIGRLGHRINSYYFRKSWITGVLDGFNLLNMNQVISTSICTILFNGILVLQMFCLIQAFQEISLFHAFAGTSAMMFVKSLLPISLGDLGIREAGSILFFSHFGISQTAAFNGALLLFVINVFVPGVIGTIFLRHQHLHAHKIFQLLKK